MKLHFEGAELADGFTAEVLAGNTDRLKFLKLDRKAKTQLVGFISEDCLGIVKSKEKAKLMWREGHFLKKSVAGVPVEMKQIVFLPELSVKKLSKAEVDVLFTGGPGREKAVMKFIGAVIAETYLRNNLYELELEVNMSGGTANLCGQAIP